MPQTTLTIQQGQRSVDELIQAAETVLKATPDFNAIAFRQRLSWAHSDADKLALLKEFVKLE